MAETRYTGPKGASLFHRRSRYGTATVRPHTVRPGNATHPFTIRLRAELAEAPPLDPKARDGKMARLEAALMLADEPLPARKIAEVVGLADSAEARKLIERLKELYDLDGSAF